MVCMSAIAGRRRRPANAPTVLVQARVDPALREKVHRAAKAAGVSVARYMELLIAHEQLDENGRPVWWPEDPNPTQEELPLKTAS